MRPAPLLVALLGLSTVACAAAADKQPAAQHGEATPLAACPQSPNCVTSVPGGGPPDRVVLPLRSEIPGVIPPRMVAAVEALPGCTIENSAPDRIHATCRSKLFGFIDDLDLMAVQDAPVVHVRSGARLGWWDFGVNRARVEKLRALCGDSQTP